MSDTEEILKQKIARTERDHALAIAKSREHQAKAAEYAAKAESLQTFLQHLNTWHNELTQSVLSIGNTGNKAIGSGTEIVPVRAIVRELFYELQEFTTDELIEAVQAINADAKSNSIVAELSKSKTRADVEQIGLKQYRSLLYPSIAEITQSTISGEDGPRTDATSIVDTEDATVSPHLPNLPRETTNEPAPGFGRI